jgi:hypothetical protein
MRSARLVLASLVFIPSIALGQTTVQLEPGTKVRVSAHHGLQETFGEGAFRSRVSVQPVQKSGTLLWIRPDSLSVLLEEKETEWRIPLDRVVRVEARENRTRGQGMVRGAGWGMGIGALVGLVAGAASCTGGGWTCPEDEGGAVLIVALEGAAVGLMIGAVWPGDHWVETPLPASIPPPDSLSPIAGIR